jgi:hypothetical protein
MKIAAVIALGCAVSVLATWLLLAAIHGGAL